MAPTAVRALYYSATGNTRKLTVAAAESASASLGVPMSAVDFTLPSAREGALAFSSDEVAVIGFPTYRSKLPLHICDDLASKVRGDSTPAIVIVSYGNRSYADSVAQLVSVLKRNGFVPVAAAAYPSRHAYSDLVGAGRPDADDLRDAEGFAGEACRIITAGISGRTLEVPGDPDAPLYVPLGEDGKPVSFLHARPKVYTELCNRCGRCADLCPLGSIDRKDPEVTHGDCFKCQACIRGCPSGARFFDDPQFVSHVRQLESLYTERKEIEHFL